jgi:hypothetical protein
MMTPDDGPWSPPKPSRGRWILAGILASLTVVLIVGARAAFTAGLRGDFPIYYRAADAILHGRSLQEAADQGYLAPPLCATVMAPLALLSQALAAQVWTGFTLLLFGAMFWLGARDAVERWRLPRGSFYVLAVLATGAVCSFGQLRAELRNGQVDGLLVLGFVFGLVCLERRPGLAGACIGFAANIKYTAILLVPYLLFRRRLRAALAAGAWTIAFALLPALVSGWSRNLTNLSISLAGILRLLGVDIGAHAASNIPELDYSRSVSLTSAVARVALSRAGHGGMYLAVAVLAAAIIAVCCWMYRRQGFALLSAPERPARTAVTSLEWCGVIVAVLLFSPQTQVRHMVVLLPLHLAAAAIVLARPAYSRWVVLGLIAEQAGLNLPPGSLISDETSEMWRATGWPCWCLLACYLGVLWGGLRTAAGLRGATDPSRA